MKYPPLYSATGPWIRDRTVLPPETGEYLVWCEPVPEKAEDLPPEPRIAVWSHRKARWLFESATHRITAWSHVSPPLENGEKPLSARQASAWQGSTILSRARQAASRGT